MTPRDFWRCLECDSDFRPRDVAFYHEIANPDNEFIGCPNCKASCASDRVEYVEPDIEYYIYESGRVKNDYYRAKFRETRG